MKKVLVKEGRKIVGFVGENYQGYFYAFGKPSQASYMAYYCPTVQSGVKSIKDSLKGFKEVFGGN